RGAVSGRKDSAVVGATVLFAVATRAVLPTLREGVEEPAARVRGAPGHVAHHTDEWIRAALPLLTVGVGGLARFLADACVLVAAAAGVGTVEDALVLTAVHPAAQLGNTHHRKGVARRHRGHQPEDAVHRIEIG